jgi:hypothetical protein
MYEPRAENLRHCVARKKNGERCRAWAMWDDEVGFCYAHAGRPRGRRLGAPPCTCAAYKWPHRPGGGLCRWPDPPYYRSSIPAGTHRSGRSNSELTRLANFVFGGIPIGGHGLSDEERRRIQSGWG